jgi:radical SAM-linked protein
MLRRSGLPFHATEGFNPKPRLIFALSLALGIVGADEVVELELDEELSTAEIQSSLSRQAPAGLTILSVQRLAPRASAQVRRVCYQIAFPPNQREHATRRIHTLLSAEHCWVDRTRPRPRRVNLRPYVRDIQVTEAALEMDLWVTPNGAARPEEILAVLELSYLLDQGAVLARTLVELHDECGAAEPGPMSPGSEDRAREARVCEPRLNRAGAGPLLNTQLEGNS